MADKLSSQQSSNSNSQSEKLTTLTGNKCGTCRKLCKTDEPCLRCEICDFWHHIVCEDVDLEIYNIHVAKPTKTFHWNCNKCEASTKKLSSKIDSLTVKLSELENRVTSIEQEAISRPELEQNYMKVSGVTNVMAQQKQMEEVLEKTFNEMSDRDKRRNNLIFYSIPECRNEDPEQRKIYDLDCVQKVCQQLDLNLQSELCRPVRLGKHDPKTEKPRPLRITVANEPAKKEILTKAKKLAKNESEVLKKIFITNDKTPTERRLAKKMREEKTVSRKETNGCDIVGVTQSDQVFLNPSDQSVRLKSPTPPDRPKRKQAVSSPGVSMTQRTVM